MGRKRLIHEKKKNSLWRTHSCVLRPNRGMPQKERCESSDRER
jgi:hypothetical protein